MNYQYKSPVGRFFIKPLRNDRWGLQLKDELLGSYHSPMAAADDVNTQATGDLQWDVGVWTEVPSSIHGWEVVSQ